MANFDLFEVEFEKTIVIFEISVLEFVLLQSLVSQIFGIKNAFGYILAGI